MIIDGESLQTFTQGAAFIAGAVSGYRQARTSDALIPGTSVETMKEMGLAAMVGGSVDLINHEVILNRALMFSHTEWPWIRVMRYKGGFDDYSFASVVEYAGSVALGLGVGKVVGGLLNKMSR